jgi:hypothetical protein
MDVEYLGPISTTPREEKIQHPSRVEEIDEENKIQKMYISQGTSQANRKTISYTDPIHPNILIPQTTFGLSEYQSQQGGMGHLCPMGIQNDWRNQMVDQNYKNQQTSSYFDQSHFPSSKSKCKNKSKKRNGEIITRREKPCDTIGNGKLY